MREIWRKLGDRLGVAVLHDVGSGSLLPTERYGLAHEPMPQESVCSPGWDWPSSRGTSSWEDRRQGIVVGRRELVGRSWHGTRSRER